MCIVAVLGHGNFPTVTHQTCLVLWTWRKLADETNVKNTHKICQDYPYVKNEYNAHHSHLLHKKNILMQEMNAASSSHPSHENCQEAEESKGLVTISV